MSAGRNKEAEQQQKYGELGAGSERATPNVHQRARGAREKSNPGGMK